MCRLSSNSHRCRYVTIVLLVTIVACLAGGVTVGVYVLRQWRISERVAIRLHTLILGLDNYWEIHKQLPPTTWTNEHGHVLYSWRVGIMPYMESAPDVAWDAPWYAPANQEWANLSADCYCVSPDVQRNHHTNIVAVTGPGTAFDPTRLVRWEELPSDTVLLISVAESGIHWMQPGDISVNKLPRGITSGVCQEGVHVAFADGAVWFLRQEMPREYLSRFFTIRGATRYDRTTVLAPYVTAKHAPGFQTPVHAAQRDITKKQDGHTFLIASSLASFLRQ